LGCGDAAVEIISSRIGEAFIVVSARVPATHNRFVIHGTSRIGGSLAAALGLGISGSVSLALIVENARNIAALNRLDRARAGNIVGNGVAALHGIVSSRIGEALGVIHALLATGRAAGNGGQDGRTGAAGAGVLAAVGADVESGTFGLADRSVFAAGGTAGVGIGRFARAVLAAGGTLGWGRRALAGAVSGERGKAVVGVGALFATAFDRSQDHGTHTGLRTLAAIGIDVKAGRFREADVGVRAGISRPAGMRIGRIKGALVGVAGRATLGGGRGGSEEEESGGSRRREGEGGARENHDCFD